MISLIMLLASTVTGFLAAAAHESKRELLRWADITLYLLLLAIFFKLGLK